ncbi:hypothetical protein [Ramlibacter sp.]|uniref:hypothetical protein n=1 Tax=Ramlibacter sp. TaxID=1917967 RepID=UPI002C0804F1|nr:hypothetical protein [Ramlibacter sp.]HWI83648.1 hypothetical protein [Ramlibacter sp.]
MEVWSSFLSGTAELGLRRNVILVSVSREQSEVGFFSILALYSLFGVVCIWYTLRLLRGAAQPKDAANEAFAAKELAQIEAVAPSGLKPLWIGLLIFVACFLVYVAIAA